MNEQLLLKNIRGVLVRLEETILFALIERGQFCRNGAVYEPGRFGEAIGADSLCGYLLRQTEAIHARMRRYTSPDEHAFHAALPEPVLPPLRFAESPLFPNRININPVIRKTYEEDIIPLLCLEGDDQQYGSTSVCDVACLQAISKRIHYGKFVAESKYQELGRRLDDRVRARDRAGVVALITVPEVESAVLERVDRKARSYTAEIGGADSRRLAAGIVEVYRQWIIPLTKDVEVDYLFLRAGVPA